MLNFSNDINLADINFNAGKDLETRLTSTLEGITTTYHLLTGGVSGKTNFDYKSERYPIKASNQVLEQGIVFGALNGVSSITPQNFKDIASLPMPSLNTYKSQEQLHLASSFNDFLKPAKNQASPSSEEESDINC